GARRRFARCGDAALRRRRRRGARAHLGGGLEARGAHPADRGSPPAGDRNARELAGGGGDMNQAVQDKIEIEELLYRYARACARKDWALLPTVFTPDAYLDYTSAGCPAGSRDEVCKFLEEALSTVPMTQHFITNIEIDLDGDRAHVTAMFYNPMQLPGMAEMSFCGGGSPPPPRRPPPGGGRGARAREEHPLRRTHEPRPTPPAAAAPRRAAP